MRKIILYYKASLNFSFCFSEYWFFPINAAFSTIQISQICQILNFWRIRCYVRKMFCVYGSCGDLHGDWTHHLQRVLGGDDLLHLNKYFHVQLLCPMHKLKVWVGGMPQPQKGPIHYHTQLGFQDICRAVNGLVVCYVVCLRSMKGMGLNNM